MASPLLPLVLLLLLLAAPPAVARSRKRPQKVDPDVPPPPHGYKTPIPDKCPQFMTETSGVVNDMGLLAEAVSWDAGDAQGVCGTWKHVRTCEAVYNTRMRIYQSGRDANTFAVVFRPTQTQTAEGEAIHHNRTMVNCTFLDGGCQGQVHNKFQQAFEELIAKCWTDVGPLRGKRVYVTGHSLGGGMSVFMSIKLWKVMDQIPLDLGTLPVMTLGWAGPFVGDKAFNDAYQIELKEKMKDNWWQVETVMPRKGQRPMLDPTCSDYDLYRIYPLNTTICGLYIEKQINGSYGMHDLHNFRSALNGTDCAALPRLAGGG